MFTIGLCSYIVHVAPSSNYSLVITDPQSAFCGDSKVWGCVLMSGV